jgi:hypothetical protein
MAQDSPEVSFMWTKHWRQARKLDPDLPIICMHRDKYDTVASHLRICAGRDRLRTGQTLGGDFDYAYPKLPEGDPRNAMEAWAFWYDIIEALMAEIDGPVWHMEIEDLNDPAEMAKIRLWLKEQGRWV